MHDFTSAERISAAAAAPVSTWHDCQSGEHFVQFYEDDAVLISGVSDYVIKGLSGGAAAVVVATADHVRALEARWAAAGIDLEQTRAQGLYVALDASATLNRFLHDGWPQRQAFQQVFEPVVAAAAKRGSEVIAFGEMVALLWKERRYGAAIQLEEFWNELAKKYRFSLFCAYPLSGDRLAPADALRKVCSAHSRAIPTEKYTRLPSAAERAAAICELQNRALVLEQELAERKRLELELARRDLELSDFLENAVHPMHSVGPDGTILWANRAELDMLGYSPEQYIGHSARDFYVDPQTFDSIWTRLATGETLRNVQARLRARGGEIRHVMISSNGLWKDGSFVHTRCFTRDITEQVHAEDARREGATMLQLAMEVGNIGVWTRDLNTNAIQCSPELERILGIERGGFPGSFDDFTALVHPFDRERLVDALQRAISSHGDFLVECRVRHASGTWHCLETRGRAHYDDAGRAERVYGVAIDVTERRRTEESLRKHAEAMQEADRRKDEFLALLAHELRNPLAPIRYALGTARKADRTPEEARRAEEIIDRQVTHMSRLLDDLLDVSRITRGTLELKKSRMDLAAIAATAIEAARPVLDSKHHTLSINLPGEPVRIEADPVRLAQVLSNLLINAGKYTDPGGRVELSATQSRDEVVLRVRDNGIGISAEMMPRLFTMFSQAEGALARSEGGLGIGLALARGLIDLHGGSITAHSSGMGLGSEFVIRLPATSPAPQADIAGPETTDVAGSPVRVLVADDNRDSATTCGAFLESCGHDVRIAFSGVDAVATAENFQPQVVILDIGMPQMDGYEVARRLRRQSWARNCLLIAVTGWGQERDKERASAAGFDHHLTKPIDPAMLEPLLSQAASERADATG